MNLQILASIRRAEAKTIKVTCVKKIRKVYIKCIGFYIPHPVAKRWLSWHDNPQSTVTKL